MNVSRHHPRTLRKVFRNRRLSKAPPSSILGGVLRNTSNVIDALKFINNATSPLGPLKIACDVLQIIGRGYLVLGVGILDDALI
jgi:hypothetical protein